MILFLLDKTEKLSSFDNKVIKWIKRNIRSENIDYRLLFVNLFLKQSDVSKLDLGNDKIQFIFWSSKLTKYNLSIVKEFPNSVVLLTKESVFSVNNYQYFTENDAINHNLNIMYLEEEEQDYNKDWKLAIKKSFYNLSQRTILEQIYNNESNYKNNETKEEFEDNYSDLTKIQFL